MLSQEQIDILTDMFGLEWGDYVEYLEDEQNYIPTFRTTYDKS